jgi:hypothetical protein
VKFAGALILIVGIGIGGGVILASVSSRSQSISREVKPIMVPGPVVPIGHDGVSTLIIVPACSPCSYKNFDVYKILPFVQENVLIVAETNPLKKPVPFARWVKRSDFGIWSVLSEGAVYSLDGKGRIVEASWGF